MAERNVRVRVGERARRYVFALLALAKRILRKSTRRMRSCWSRSTNCYHRRIRCSSVRRTSILQKDLGYSKSSLRLPKRNRYRNWLQRSCYLRSNVHCCHRSWSCCRNLELRSWMKEATVERTNNQRPLEPN